MRYTMLLLTTILLSWASTGFHVAAQDDNAPMTIDQIVLSGDTTVDSGTLAVRFGTDAIVYDLSELAAEPRIYPMGNDDGHISLSADGALLSLPADCNEIEVLDTANNEVVALLRADFPFCDPVQLAFSPDGRHAFFSDGRLFTVTDLLEAGDAEATDLQPASPSSVHYSPDGTHLLFPDPSSTDLLIYDVQSGDLVAQMNGIGARYDRFAISADNQFVVALDNQEPTALIEIATGEIIQSYWQDTEAAGLAAWLNGARGQLRLVHRGAASEHPTFWRIFDQFEQSLDDVTTITLSTTNATRGTFSADGSLLAIVTEENTIALHDGSAGALIATLTLPPQIPVES